MNDKKPDTQFVGKVHKILLDDSVRTGIRSSAIAQDNKRMRIRVLPLQVLFPYSRDVVLATQAHSKKAFHLGFGKHASRSTMADANSKRDYRIFEEFAYRVVAEARACRADDIFKLGGNVYAFDSTTIELCLETFKWALYRKNQRKGGVKVHTLYDIETSIPTFFHITEARVHDMNAMDVIPYEENSFYIFDRGYNDLSDSIT